MKVKLSGEEEFDQLIGPVRKISKFITIWPVEVRDEDGDVMKYKRSRQLQIIHTAFIFLYLGCMLASQIADAIRNRENVDDFIESCLVSSTVTLTLLRLTIYIKHHKHIIIAVETMRSDWGSASEADRRILRKKCSGTFLLSRYFIICISTTMFLIFIYPIFLVFIIGYDEWLMPYGGYFGVDMTKSPTYQILYVIEILGGIYGLSNVAAVTGFNLVSIMHAAAKFVVLQNHLAELKNDEQISEKLLCLYIQEHQRAIEFADILESIINKVALGQFIVSTGLVCFAGLRIATMMDNKAYLMRYLTFLISAIFELFLFSYSGYQLTLQSELIADSAFNSGWIGSLFTKNLQILMMRATKPSKITAAKFYDMSLESFATVLSTSFSYFTTIRAATDE